MPENMTEGVAVAASSGIGQAGMAKDRLTIGNAGSGIDQQCEHLDVALDRLYDDVAVLRDRLAPVLGEPSPEASPASVQITHEGASELTKFLCAQANRVDETTRALRDIVARLEV